MWKLKKIFTLKGDCTLNLYQLGFCSKQGHKQNLHKLTNFIRRLTKTEFI